MTDGVTEKARKSQLMDSGLSTKVYKKGNLFIEQLKCDGEGVRDNSELSRRQASKKSF